jgi:NACHT domain
VARRLAERHTGIVFVADDLAAWLISLLADAGRKKLTALILGDDQERALHLIAAVAVQRAAAELCPGDDEQAEHLAMVVSEVFGEPVPVSRLAADMTVLEALQAGIAGQLAVLDDASLTGTGRSSAEVLGVSGGVVAKKLTAHLLREIVTRGARGGPLFPLASQLNDDVTHLQGRRIETVLGQLTNEVRQALAGLDGSHAVAAARGTPPLLESARPYHGDVEALMWAQVRASEELPYRLFGVRRPPLSSVYVRQTLSGGASPGSALASLACSVEEALDRHRHLILIGGPGLGKSTLTLQLVHRLARDWLVSSSSSAGDHRGQVGLVPLRVTGRELAAAIDHPWLQALCDAARNELGGHLDLEADFSSDLLKKQVGETPWLIAIDGLDEAVEPERRDKLVTVLSARLTGTALPHRLLVTSRPLHPTEMARLGRDADVNEVGVYELEPFNDAALEDFARRWLTADPRPPGVDPATRFVQEAQNNHVTDALSTPLLALMALVLFEEDRDGTLPRFEYDLYERYLDYVVTTAVRQPGWRAVTTELAELTQGSGHALHDPFTLEALLQHLAAIQVSSDMPLAVAAGEWLTGNTVPALRRPPEWQATVESLLTRSGLLVRRGSRLEFIHHSFAEHLAAAAEAAKMPDKFDPSDPVLHECINRTRDPFTSIPLITLIHWVRRVPSVAPALLTWLQQGHWHHQELAARMLISGIARQAQHLDSACQAIERRVVALEEGQPTWLLAALARQHPAAVDALDRISANSMVPPWARADALAAAVKIRGLTAEEAATSLRTLLDERRAGAGWSQVIAAAALLELGEESCAEAIQILRDILADPYTHPDAKASAATALSGAGPDLRAEALAALRAIIADPLADYHERRFAARGLASAGFPAEAASALNAILADPQASAWDKALTSFSFQNIPKQDLGEAIAAFKAMMDDATADPNERWVAAWALIHVSSDRRPEAIAILREAIADPSCPPYLLWVSGGAAETITSLAPEHLTEVIQALRTILGDPVTNPWTRVYAARAMVRLDFDEYEEVIGVLTELTNSSSDPDHRFVAARGLALFGPALHSDALNTVRALLADPATPLSTRCDAAGFLGELAPASIDEAVQILRELAAGPQAGAGDLLKAAHNLMTISRTSDAEAAIWLLTALNDVTAESWTRAEAADQLIQLQTSDPHAGINVLRTILNDADTEEELRIWVARRLAKCGSQYREEALAALTQT